MPTTNSDPIQDYILESEDKFHIASAVSDAWTQVRARVVSDFFDRLKRALRQEKAVEGWWFERWQLPFEDSEARFSFGKQTWDQNYYLCLTFFHYGKKVCFCLRRDPSRPRVKDRSPSGELLAAVRKQYPSARQDKWWEARVTVPSLPEDWRKPDVLWRMRDEKGDFLKEVAEHLLKVAAISVPFVDKLVARK